MEITKEQIKAVFTKWNKNCLENPEVYNQANPTLENVEKYSGDQAEDFVKVYDELYPMSFDL